MSRRAADGTEFPLVDELKKLADRVEQGKPAVFISKGGPEDGQDEGVTIWEHGTTNSLYFPKATLLQLMVKVEAVGMGTSKGEMIQR